MITHNYKHMSGWICIASYFDITIAEMNKNFLVANGIKTQIISSSGSYPILPIRGTIQLFVLEKDRLKAETLLKV